MGVESDGWLFENVESGFPLAGGSDFLAGGCCSAGELGDELNTLGFTATESRAGLPEFEIAEARLLEESNGSADLRMRGKKLHRLIDRHIHHVAD